ncbi:hypothetical protein GCM10023220_35330 [Streptomyces ziwulingensis]|uniref:Transposase IS4-like domain-containing protein n=1 Tax=Streptomyces ziwulingensis TaxID=1045501 RepID=A0ABP9C0B0_9ACTN
MLGAARWGVGRRVECGPPGLGFGLVVSGSVYSAAQLAVCRGAGAVVGDERSVVELMRSMGLADDVIVRVWLGKVRWVVERAFAWLHQFKRLRTRYEQRADLHQGPLELACILICLRRLRTSF